MTKLPKLPQSILEAYKQEMPLEKASQVPLLGQRLNPFAADVSANEPAQSFRRGRRGRSQTRVSRRACGAFWPQLSPTSPLLRGAHRRSQATSNRGTKWTKPLPMTK